MISWIQRSFQHHFRVVFAILLAVTIVSFIITIGATPGIGRGDRRVVSRDFFGLNLASRDDMMRMTTDAGISLELQLGSQSGLDDQQMKNYAMQRIAALHLADQWHVPQSTSPEMTDFIKGLRVFADKDGAFDKARYDSFRASLRNSPGSTEADISRVIGEDIRMQKVELLLDGPGYVLPDDVKSQLAIADTSWTLSVATVDYASFQPDLKPTDADLAKFYQENDFRYQIPARIAAGYLDFAAADYVSQVKGTGDAKAKLEQAKRLAAKAASDMAYALYQSKLPYGAPLDAYLLAHKLSLKPLAPFAAEAGPAELGGTPEVAETAAALDKQYYFSEAVATPDGAAILIWKDSLPARKPLLAEVKDKVKADYSDVERRRRFDDLGRTLRATLQARLKSGETFDKAAATAARSQSVKIESKSFPAFTLRTPPKDLPQPALGKLDALDKGTVSEMALDADKGYLVYAADKKLPDLSPTGAEFAQMRASIAAFMAQRGASSYLGELVAQELKRTEPPVK